VLNEHKLCIYSVWCKSRPMMADVSRCFFCV